MNRQLRVISGILAVIAVVAVGALTYIYVKGGAGTPSAPINAPELAPETTSQKVYRIDSAQSEVSFTLNEVLMGNPKTVVGKTNQVAGDIAVDLNQPANTKIGVIRIDARSIATDSGMRDRMIRSEILQSSQDKFEFIQFEPTKITGLPATVSPGQAVTFKVEGNLTVRDITKPVSFDVTTTLVAGSPELLKGSATTVVKRADFNLVIPNVASVSGVTEEVKLDINFTATLVDSSAIATATAAK
jgi:polyisoprenoid-binding protein YceI